MQAPHVVVGAMGNYGYRRVGQQTSQGGQVGDGQWVQQENVLTGRDLDQANFLSVGMQAVGFGVQGQQRLRRQRLSDAVPALLVVDK